MFFRTTETGKFPATVQNNGHTLYQVHTAHIKFSKRADDSTFSALVELGISSNKSPSMKPEACLV